MRKLCVVGFLVLMLLIAFTPTASAWNQFDWYTGARLGVSKGGNSVLWGLWVNAPTPPGFVPTGAWAGGPNMVDPPTPVSPYYVPSYPWEFQPIFCPGRPGKPGESLIPGPGVPYDFLKPGFYPHPPGCK